jgi:hypothetical protein
VIDFLAVLFGYAVSGEQTLEAFYERLQPWADAFMALFGRDRLPARATLLRIRSTSDTQSLVLRLQPMHRLVLALLGPTYEHIYQTSS